MKILKLDDNHFGADECSIVLAKLLTWRYKTWPTKVHSTLVLISKYHERLNKTFEAVKDKSLCEYLLKLIRDKAYERIDKEDWDIEVGTRLKWDIDTKFKQLLERLKE